MTRELYDDLRKNQYEPNGSLLAYKKADVDHNTINNQRAIAELKSWYCSWFTFKKEPLPAQWQSWVCQTQEGFCVVEPQLSAIKEHKKKGKLLTIYEN